MFFWISAENPKNSMCFFGFLLKIQKHMEIQNFQKFFGAPTSFGNFGNFGFRDCATENTIGSTRETSILAVLSSGNFLLKN